MRRGIILLLIAVLTMSFAGIASATHTECHDNIDNDGDRKIDYPDDPGCTSPDDFHETGDDTAGTSCRASLVRIQGQGLLRGLGTIEPFVANRRNVPCRSDQAGILGLGTFIPVGQGGVGLTLLDAQTFGPGPGAFSGVLLVTVLNPANGNFVFGTAVLTSFAEADCPGRFRSASSILAVGLGQREVNLTAPATIRLGGLGTLYLNRRVRQPNQVTQQAVFLDTGLADITIAEAKVDCR